MPNHKLLSLMALVGSLLWEQNTGIYHISAQSPSHLCPLWASNILVWGTWGIGINLLNDFDRLHSVSPPWCTWPHVGLCKGARVVSPIKSTIQHHDLVEEFFIFLASLRSFGSLAELRYWIMGSIQVPVSLVGSLVELLNCSTLPILVVSNLLLGTDTRFSLSSPEARRPSASASRDSLYLVHFELP